MTPSEREEIENKAAYILKDRCRCRLEQALTGCKHICFFCEITEFVLTQVAKARNDQLKDDIKIVEGYSFMEAKDGYLGLDHEDSIAYQAGQEVKRGIVKALRSKLEKE